MQCRTTGFDGLTHDSQWKEIDGGQLMDSKLKCVFVMPNDDGCSSVGAPNDNVNNVKSDNYQSAAKQSGVPPSPKVSPPPQATTFPPPGPSMEVPDRHNNRGTGKDLSPKRERNNPPPHRLSPFFHSVTQLFPRFSLLSSLVPAIEVLPFLGRRAAASLPPFEAPSSSIHPRRRMGSRTDG